MTEKKQEIGHAIPAWGLHEEENFQLTFPFSSRIYSKMVREDAQVRAVVQAMTLPIRRTSWHINPQGADPEVVKRVAEDLRLPVLGEDPNEPQVGYQGHVSWDTTLQRILQSLIYGHSFFEQVYETDDNGEEHLRKLAYRPSSTISEIVVDDDGGLAGIKQAPLKPKAKEIFIPVDRLVAFVHDPMDMSWTGTSALRSAFKHWVYKDKLIRLEYSAIDRQSMGLPIYTGSQMAKNPDADLKAGQALATAARGGDSAGGAIPAGAKFDLIGVSGQVISPRAAIAYHDEMIGKAVLAHFLNLSDGGGSYALAETQSDLFIQSLQSTAQWVADITTQHIIEDLIRIAFPGYEGAIPTLGFVPIASKAEISWGDLAQLIIAGAVIPDKDLEEDIRQKSSLPAKRPYDPSESGVSEKKANAAKALAEAGFDLGSIAEIIGAQELQAAQTEITDTSTEPGDES